MNAGGTVTGIDGPNVAWSGSERNDAVRQQNGFIGIVCDQDYVFFSSWQIRLISSRRFARVRDPRHSEVHPAEGCRARAKARATETRWRIPPESSAGPGRAPRPISSRLLFNVRGVAR